MAVRAHRTLTPWWLSAALLWALLILFLGQRPFEQTALGPGLTWLGVAVIAGVLGIRVWAFVVAEAAYRKVELIQLLCTAGVILALLGFAITQDGFQDLVGIDFSTKEAAATFATAATVVWLIIMVASLVPLILIEVSLGTSGRHALILGRAGDDTDTAPKLEIWRVREAATSGLTIALAAAFLMVTCQVAADHNVRKDVSYFKTSSPGSATVKVAKTVHGKLRVLLFFPDVNRVKDEVRGYFEALNRQTGNLIIEEHDRMMSPVLAKAHSVRDDGTIVIIREKDGSDDAAADKTTGDKKTKPKEARSEKVTVNPDFKVARRTELRDFDKDVYKALMKVVRDPKVAYFTVGHGELNDPDSAPAGAKRAAQFSSSLIKTRLGMLNYRVDNLGLSDGLAQAVPDDASVVFVLAPQSPLLDSELASLARYLEGGGSVFITLDPDSPATLGTLEETLGVHFDPTPLADERYHAVSRRNPSDNGLLITNQFSSHASITTVGRSRERAGILLFNPGSLVTAPGAKTGKGAAKRTFIIRSMATTFADTVRNFTFDEGQETKSRKNLAAAIEGPAPKGAKAGDHGMRAMVFTDAEMFSDAVLVRAPMLQILIDDAIRWLGGEEDLAGTIQSEKDVKIQHTEDQDKLWFYSTVGLAPFLVLALGLGYVWWYRRRQRRRS